MDHKREHQSDALPNEQQGSPQKKHKPIAKVEVQVEGIPFPIRPLYPIFTGPFLPAMQPLPAPAPTSHESDEQITAQSSHVESDITRISFREGIHRMCRDKETLSKADFNAKYHIHDREPAKGVGPEIAFRALREMGLGEFDGEGDDDDEDKEDEEVEGVKTSKKDDVMNKAEGDKGMYSGKIITKSKK